MVSTKSYTIVHAKGYSLDGEEAPYVLSIAHGDLYASRDMTGAQLRQLRADISELLEETDRAMVAGDIGANPICSFGKCLNREHCRSVGECDIPF